MAFNNFAEQHQHRLFKEQDLQQLVKHVMIGKGFSMEKVTKRIYLEMAQTFIEEVLDLPASEKTGITKEILARQIYMKFPEIARDDPNVEITQRRNTEIEKEDLV